MHDRVSVDIGSAVTEFCASGDEGSPPGAGAPMT